MKCFIAIWKISSSSIENWSEQNSPFAIPLRVKIYIYITTNNPNWVSQTFFKVKAIISIKKINEQIQKLSQVQRLSSCRPLKGISISQLLLPRFRNHYRRGNVKTIRARDGQWWHGNNAFPTQQSGAGTHINLEQLLWYDQHLC